MAAERSAGLRRSLRFADLKNSLPCLVNARKLRWTPLKRQDYPPAIKRGNRKSSINGSLSGKVGKSTMKRGIFSIAMFDHHRVRLVLGRVVLLAFSMLFCGVPITVVVAVPDDDDDGGGGDDDNDGGGDDDDDTAAGGGGSGGGGGGDDDRDDW